MAAKQTAHWTSAGLTLTEMLVVLGIVSVLLAVTVPLVGSFMRRGEMQQAITVVQMAALRARSLALERRENCDLVLDGTNHRVWVRRAADEARPIEQALVGEAHALPETVRLLLWWQPPGHVRFSPTGGLTSGTQLGFHLVGVHEYEGVVQSTGAGTLTVSGTPWSPDGRWVNYYVVFMSGPPGVKGQARAITASTSNQLTIQGVWSATEDPWKAPPAGTQFVIVAPNNIRHLMIYGTTGAVKAGDPPSGA